MNPFQKIFDAQKAYFASNETRPSVESRSAR